LQYADSASLDLLRYLDLALCGHSESEPFRFAILCSFSRHDASDELLDLATTIATRRHGHHIKLRAFGEPGTHAFLRALGLQNPSRRLIEDAHQHSNGNPLVLKELIYDLRERGALEELNGETRSTIPLGELATTTSVAEWISGKIGSFDAREAMILSGCALIGFEIDQKIFREQVEQQGKDPEDLIRRAIQARLLKRTHGRLDFYHPLIRKALAKRLTPDQTQRIHVEIAKQWDGAHHHDPRLRDLEAARHLVAAGPHAEPSRVIRYSKRAAQHALDRAAWAEAAFFLEATLEHTTNPIERAELHDRAARAHFRRLDAEPCLRHFDRAIDLLRHTGDRNRYLEVLSGYIRARVWLGEPWPHGSNFETEELRRALDSLENDDRALRVQLLTALSEYEFFLGNEQQANQLRLEAATSGEPVRDPTATAALSMSLGATAYHELRIREALDIWHHGIERARLAGDSLIMASCLQRVQMASFCAGDFAAIESLEKPAREISQSTQLLGQPALTSSLRAAIALQRGDFRSSERHVQETTALLAQKRYPWLVMVIAPAMANIRALAGDLAGAQKALDLMSDPAISFRESIQRDGLAKTCRALCNCYVGEPAGLSPKEDERLRSTLGMAKHDDRSLFTACFAAELAEPTQDAQLAALALPCLRTAESLGWILTQTWPLFIPRLLGVAATLVNDFEL
ncbi:MAG: ATP-binding protein, partial [Planctomycetota bacterium]